MIDIKNEILTTLNNTLIEKFNGISLKSSYQLTSPTFPCVTFDEVNNSTDVASVDSSGEFSSNLSFEINIYTFGNKSETTCLKIRNEIDNIMNGNYGMLRISSNRVVNYADTRVFRWVLRYSCTIDKAKLIYRG